MKKSVMLMVGILAVALTGSAQAAPMFAVQDSTPADRFTVDADGSVNAAGLPLNLGGKMGVTLSNVPVPPPATGFTAITGPYGPLHLATKGNAGSTAAFIAQNVTTGAGSYPPGVAPSFSFYRINQNTGDSSYVLPLAGDSLGVFGFGTINYLADPNTSSSRKNGAQFSVIAESAWSGTIASNVLTINNTPTAFVWKSSATGGSLVEMMRLTSTGNLGIGTANPSSKLQVVGLPEYADNNAAKSANPPLTDGAFYRTGDIVKVVHP